MITPFAAPVTKGTAASRLMLTKRTSVQMTRARLEPYMRGRAGVMGVLMYGFGL
ncbi:hypothetical protein [Streptomyces sp. NPDC056227]|uniref:hypothetical protein n=1 Tax=Streptomyces sp. NPDC056227 TaxID=3345753 RepID=UPI0035D78725